MLPFLSVCPCGHPSAAYLNNVTFFCLCVPVDTPLLSYDTTVEFLCFDRSDSLCGCCVVLCCAPTRSFSPNQPTVRPGVRRGDHGLGLSRRGSLGVGRSRLGELLPRRRERPVGRLRRGRFLWGRSRALDRWVTFISFLF